MFAGNTRYLLETALTPKQKYVILPKSLLLIDLQIVVTNFTKYGKLTFSSYIFKSFLSIHFEKYQDLDCHLKLLI